MFRMCPRCHVNYNVERHTCDNAKCLYSERPTYDEILAELDKRITTVTGMIECAPNFHCTEHLPTLEIAQHVLTKFREFVIAIQPVRIM